MDYNNKTGEVDVRKAVTAPLRSVNNHVFVGLIFLTILNKNLPITNCDNFLVLSDRQFPHYIVPALTSCTSDKQHNGHTKTLEVEVLIQLLLQDDITEHSHPDDSVNEQQQEYQCSYVCEWLQDHQ